MKNHNMSLQSLAVLFFEQGINSKKADFVTEKLNSIDLAIAGIVGLAFDTPLIALVVFV